MPFKSLIRAVVLLPFIVPTFTDTKVGRAGCGWASTKNWRYRPG